MFKNLNEKDKKKIQVLLSLVVVCAIALIVIPSFSSEDSKDVQAQTDKQQQEQDVSEEKDLEKKLKSILSKIEGAGEVDVMITYDASEEIQPAYNSNTTTEKTEEKDTKGGERTVTTSSDNKTMITSGSSGPIVLKTNEAKVKGVIVVASGASDSRVKETLYGAVQTALQIAGHQVEVYAK